MNDFNLYINLLQVKLYMPLNLEELKSEKIRKLGLFSSLMIKKQKGEKVFWAKNCKIMCLDSFALIPHLDTKEGADMMQGTSAYLFFKDNRLTKVSFQLIGNKTAANYYSQKFTELVTEKYGNPDTEANQKIWSADNIFLIAEMLPNSENAHFHWFVNQN